MRSYDLSIEHVPNQAAMDSSPNHNEDSANNRDGNRLGVLELVLCSVFTYCIISRLQAILPIAESCHYDIAEWLISWEGGFVRRGLPGTLLNLLSSIHLNPVALIKTTAIASYLCLATAILKLGSHRFRLSLLLSPVLLLAPLSQGFFYKKDTFLLAIYIAMMLVLKRCLQTRTNPARENDQSTFPWAGALAFNAMALVVLLFHEGFFLLILPSSLILILTLIKRNRHRKRAQWLAITLSLPSVLWLTLATRYNGQGIDISAIEQGWHELAQHHANLGWLNGNSTLEPLKYLSHSTGDALKQSLTKHFQALYFYVAPEPLIWIILALLMIGLMLHGTLPREGLPSSESTPETPAAQRFLDLTLIASLHLFCLLPLFAVAIDWGRWLFYLSIGSFTTYCLATDPPRMQGQNTWIPDSGSAHLPAKASIPLPPRYLLLAVGIPMVTWSPAGAISTMPVYDLWRGIKSIYQAFPL